ncbi:u3 small nucleolar RNA-associated protein 11 [Lactarius akahatsu]|uniref:U3 small nucleolar RNA-associated protein 11 n=1 Tax=Lactarius akahatsu TaxID=416441 RepID=A0AAD4LNI5_9AGAM|nr:u3 small nucleolar RNA-associated protein 11 [Lactarius akahatsu]
MSSLRNSLHRRNHKERSQLSHRQRFGILEKHKDYVLRARDYHSKQDRIQRLRQKAADRNKDEFYFGMNRQKTQEGVHIQDRGNASLPVDMVKILKTQDENYVRTMRAAGLKKIEKLKDQLSALADLFVPSTKDNVNESNDDDDMDLDEDELEILEDAGIVVRSSKTRKRRPSRHQAKHVVFVENEEEARQYATNENTAQTVSLSRSKSDDLTGAGDLGWQKPERKRREKKKDTSAKAVDATDDAAAYTERSLLKELSGRLHRDRMLRYTERELEMQRLLMGKGHSKKLKGVERVDGTKEVSEDEYADAEDAGKGRQSRTRKGVDDKAYKPRVYKWRAERKR